MKKFKYQYIFILFMFPLGIIKCDLNIKFCGTILELANDYITPETKAVLVYEAGGIESDGSNIVTARKGVARFYMEVIGRQAHSGTDHHRGANAILELAHKIVAIEQETC